MAVSIVTPEGDEALGRFVAFHDQVYADRPLHWTILAPLFLPMLRGEGPFTEGRTCRPFSAIKDGRTVAQVAAVVDERFNRHWNDALGHLIMFEALPDSREAVRLVMDTACTWLADHGMRAARAGFGVNDMPFLIDDDGSLPPSILRQNPTYYHTLLKDAGFETEHGCVDYKIRVTPERTAAWARAVALTREQDFEIVPLQEVPERDRIPQFAALWHEAFSQHWGYVPQSEDEFRALFEIAEPLGVLDTSLLTYRRGEPVGALWVLPDTSAFAARAPERIVREDEKLNFLGIAVRKVARGRGVNLAMAAYSFLELVRRGATWVSYTLVMDDNWPSRRTAEKLGAHVCANYVVYRRNFRT